MLEAVMADAPELGRLDPERIDTAGAIHRLAQTWPDPFDEQRLSDLEALCHEVAVRKGVLSVYGKGWNRGSETEPLSPKWWAVLIAVLLAYGVSDEGTYGASLGLALKSVNTALRALDIAERIDEFPHLPALRVWADDVLEGLDRQSES